MSTLFPHSKSVASLAPTHLQHSRSQSGDRAVAEGLQHHTTPQFAGLSATGTCGDQPATTRLGTGRSYAVKCVNEPGTKNQSGH